MDRRVPLLSAPRSSGSRFALHVPARKHQNRRMNLERPREHLGALDAEIHTVPLDSGDGRLGNPGQSSQLVLAELLQLPNDPNRLAHRDIDMFAGFPILTRFHFLL